MDFIAKNILHPKICIWKTAALYDVTVLLNRYIKKNYR